jgi:hypothetical protein
MKRCVCALRRRAFGPAPEPEPPLYEEEEDADDDDDAAARAAAGGGGRAQVTGARATRPPYCSPYSTHD